MHEPPRSSQPRWLFWLLGGCLLMGILVIGSIVGVYYWSKNRLTALVEEQTDPVKREQNLKKMLGATTLPPGYYAGINISLGVARSAWLSDKPISDDEQRFNERGFIFNESIRAGDTASDMETFLAGRSGNVIDTMGVRLRSDETLDAGVLEVNGQQLHYYARRGEMTHERQAVAGIYSVVLIRCSDERERWAVWFQRIAPSTPTADIAKPGSVIDEGALRAFFSHFRICR